MLQNYESITFIQYLHQNFFSFVSNNVLFLKRVKHFVRYQSCDSEYKNVKCGVSQGSILGPLLFILYVNDITNKTSLFEILLFEDNTTLSYSHPYISSEINLINMELFQSR